MRLAHLIPSLALLILWPGSVAWGQGGARAQRVTCRVYGLFNEHRAEVLRETLREIPGVSLVALDFDAAELTVDCVPGANFKGTQPAEVLGWFDRQLRSASRSCFRALPRRTVPKSSLQLVVIPIRGMDCEGCSLVAYEAVATVDGVWRATASFREGRLTALIDLSKTDEAALRDALRRRHVILAKPE